MRKVFEFSGDETFWMVAESVEQAEESLKEDYGEEDLFEGEYTTREIGRDIHFEVSEETDIGIIKLDIWDMVAKDEEEAISAPYMIGSTLWQ